jgi:hypothetical protein
LRSGGGFFFSLLNGLEHVTGLRHPRPVNLLLRLAVGLRCTSTVLPTAAVEILANTFCFVAF